MLGMIVQDEDRPMPALSAILGNVGSSGLPNHVVGSDGLSVLHLAAGAFVRTNHGADDEEVLKYLLARYGNESHLEAAWGKTRLTPLMIAVVTGNLKAAKLLISAGASVRTNASFGASLLHLLRPDRGGLEALVMFRIAFVQTASSYPGIGKANTAFKTRDFADLRKVLVDALRRPREAPMAYPTGPGTSPTQSRVARFFELVRRHNLPHVNMNNDGRGPESLRKEEVASKYSMIVGDPFLILDVWRHSITRGA